MLRRPRVTTTTIVTRSPNPDAHAGKIVLVTGGTSGIGLATAKMFVASGAQKVYVCGRSPLKWEAAKSGLSPREREVMVYRSADVRVESDVESLIRRVFAESGRLDVAFNNAGVATNGSPVASQSIRSERANGVLTYTISDVSGAMCPPGTASPNSTVCENPLFTDCIGLVYCLKWELQLMREHASAYDPTDPPSIVNTASVNSFWGSPGSVMYGAAKGAVLLITRGTAVEQSQSMVGNKTFGIRINAIAPGPINTPLLRAQIGKNPTDAQVNQAASVGVPMQRIGDAAEVASVVLFLADNHLASYITGSCITVDGGLTAS